MFSIVLAALACTTPPAVGQDETDTARPQVDVYLLAGQSNMQGAGKVAELPAAWQTTIQGVYFWNGVGFDFLDPVVTKVSGRVGLFGPELGFARSMRMLEPEQEIYLVKFYRSGQPLHHGWDGNQWAGGEPAAGRRNFYPGVADDDETIGTHYRDMLAMARAAFEHLRSEGYEPVLRGIVWMQGEADAKHEVSADEYAESLARLKLRIEEDLASDPVPFVFGQVLAHEPALDRFVARLRLRERMAQADMHSGDERSVEGVCMVPTEGMPLNNDTVHYNTEGMKLLGTAFGLAMVRTQHVMAGRAEASNSD